MLWWLIAQFSARAVRSTCSTAARFGTGRLPGRPRQTGQHGVFGGAPNSVLQPQNILLAVSSSAWTSMPITASYLVAVVISSPVTACHAESPKATTKGTKNTKDTKRHSNRDGQDVQDGKASGRIDGAATRAPTRDRPKPLHP